jgi:predicted ATP-grasp superfamily ATP-dependent carboligase
MKEIPMPFHSQASHRAPAVLVGLDSLQGLQAARILARHNVPIIALAANPNHYSCRTNVCKKIIIADTESEQLIHTLELLGPQLGQKAVLFPCEDANVLLVSQHRQRLEAWYHIVLPAPEIIEIMLNKVSFYKYAQDHGLPIPRTFFIESRTDLEKIVDQLTFPCILKPPNSATPEWERHTTLSAFKVTHAAELLTLYDRHRALTDTFIVQEWIEGPDTNHYTCNCYFDAASEPVVTFTTRKLRQWPINTGIGCLGEECRNDVVLHETVRLFRSVNYRGLGYLEMKRDARSGKYFIVEPNVGRPTGRSATAEAGGVELLYTMYCDALGLPLPANREQKYTGVKWINFRQDLQSALYRWWHSDLTLQEWWQSWRGRKAHAVFAWSDPLPFLADVARVARVLFSAQERRKRNYQPASKEY